MPFPRLAGRPIMFTGDPDDPSLSKDERRRIRRCAACKHWCRFQCYTTVLYLPVTTPAWQLAPGPALHYCCCGGIARTCQDLQCLKSYHAQPPAWHKRAFPKCRRAANRASAQRVRERRMQQTSLTMIQVSPGCACCSAYHGNTHAAEGSVW